MKEFKEVIEIEKKYDITISSAKTRAQTKLDKFESELRDYELDIKEKFKKELELEMANVIQSANAKSIIEVENSKKKAKKIEATANYDDAKKFIIGKIIKFGDNNNV